MAATFASGAGRARTHVALLTAFNNGLHVDLWKL